MEQQKIRTREEQRVEDTWDLTCFYASDEAYQEENEALKKGIREFTGRQGTLKEGAKAFLETMKLYEKLCSMFDRQYVYASLRNHQDTANAFYQKMSSEIQIVGTSFGASAAWLEPEMLALTEEQLKQYFEEEPELKAYQRFVDLVTRRRSHVLDAQTEALLSRAGELGEAPSNIFSMFNNADIRFQDVQDCEGVSHPLTQGNYISYLESKDRVLRENAFRAVYAVYGQYRNTLAAAYYSNAKQADFFAKERNYGGAMEEALFCNEIPMEVYHNLIETIHSHLPLMHRYVRLRKKLLNLPELHLYDIYTPIVECPDKKYRFEEAKEIVKRGLAPLGEEYLSILQEGFDNRWIDVYENHGKRTGAYSWGSYGTHPVVLLNYQGTLDHVFTLAHEMGHSLHTYYSNQNQSYFNAGYRIFVAEVASTCNEALLIHDLMERTTDLAEKKYLINHFLDQFKGTMFRQAMFAEFELLTHEVLRKGGALTSEQLCDIYLKLNQNYFGEDMFCDPEIAYEWERIPHFYTPFYVYQYATGFAAAIAISSKILAGEPGILEKYKKFLSGGCSLSPIELLKICDVDMSSTKPVEDALDVFKNYLEEMEKLIEA
jgi:oligoendopeptidase F